MNQLIIQLTKYFGVIVITIYTYLGFSVFRYNDKKKQSRMYNQMYGLMICLHFMNFLALYVQTGNFKIVILYLSQLAMLVLVMLLYHWIYPNLNQLVMQNMLMLLTIGLTFLTRLSYDKAVRQFIYIGVSLVLCIAVPIIIEKWKFMNNMGWIFALFGIGLLVFVLLFGVENYGATNWLNLGFIQLQPSEFVKILFVISMAGLLSKYHDFKHIVLITVLAAVHVLVLVFGKDLGGALIFFVTYVFMLYVSTRKAWYLFAGLGSGIVSAYIAYQHFYHVRVRVMAWQDPWSLIDKQGYQVAQSLFAIGTGGWFGMGLGQGLPNSIPVVSSDFIFSGISEEFGAVFAIFVVLICVSCFVMFINIAMKFKNEFYKLIALGFSVMYAFQVFLNIGGVTKLIPSTGVTLPLISAGGSSMLSTIIIFNMIQGLYILNQNGECLNEEKK